jgi:hypothetical protein
MATVSMSITKLLFEIMSKQVADRAIQVLVGFGHVGEYKVSLSGFGDMLSNWRWGPVAPAQIGPAVRATSRKATARATARRAAVMEQNWPSPDVLVRVCYTSSVTSNYLRRLSSTAKMADRSGQDLIQLLYSLLVKLVKFRNTVRSTKYTAKRYAALYSTRYKGEYR